MKMVAKLSFVLCLQAVFIQYVVCQLYQNPVSGNSVVENTVVVNSGGLGGLAGYNSGLAGYNSGLAGANLAASGLAGVNLAASGLTGANLAGSLGATTLSSGTTLGGIGLGGISAAPTGVLSVTSYSPLVPAGLSVVSENTIDGAVNVNGQLPFLSAVAFESSLATSGQGAASCGCGSGNIGITSEGLPAPSYGYGGLGGLGYGGLGGRRF